ncbi:ribosomal RNA-processing protein 1 [Phytophthora boehmeriae]|uniref:Ribosomal RNA-processing protein 1 n=1 Tax=Phytophthora boehmeriae TaxID=109152 RepID=A0A8T1WUQ0_9STRA|nr:ribosomal RNA-processing protein 1 [Phytophthora boehmeriae]
MENAASRFGQHLAHTEKKYRDRALKKLTIYLTRKQEWTELEWDKLWKALFYCMWMSDKRPVQEELSTNLASLIHKIPTPELALKFVHSFFRTMHREWHGLDGLRLDKFYSLVRKFVRESVALLRVQDWDEALAEEFVTILSAEVVSQLPNGLRMHLADLYLVEIYNAASKDVTTEAFVTLLEPFFALLGSEYDKTVFKRVRELVFEAMVTDYKFGPQPEKELEENDETDEEQEEEEEDKVFEKVELEQVQHRIFALASADDTAERNRSALYTLYKRFFTVTQIDSMKASLEEPAKPKKLAKKDKKCKTMEEAIAETKNEEAAKGEDANGEKKKSKKSKKRKAKKEAEVNTEPESAIVEETKEDDSEPVTPTKKKAKKQKVEMEVKDNEKTPSAEKEGKKKLKNQKQEKQAAETVVEKVVTSVKKDSPAKEKLKQEQEKKPKDAEKKKEKFVTITKSGKRFKRCGSCGGFGKGLVPKDKSMCGHCERSQKAQKKKSAAASKKRKAESQAQAAREEQEKANSGKKVTFGKSKSLKHEASVKRLKASAKRDAVPKDSEDVKGVLKVSSPSPVASKKSKKSKQSKTRKTAADFF